MSDAMAGRSSVNDGGRNELLHRLAHLGIEARIVPYPEHRCVDEGKALRDSSLAGSFTKNLLLQDKKRRLFLVVVEEDRVIHLKRLQTDIGASKQLRFASAETMQEVLKIGPGTLTPLAAMNDRENRVTVVLDAKLLQADQLNFHPLIHTESIGLMPEELLAFITSCDRKPMVVDFSTAMTP